MLVQVLKGCVRFWMWFGFYGTLSNHDVTLAHITKEMLYAQQPTITPKHTHTLTNTETK